ncbi:MAG: hypothetical protein FWD68_08545 [Alphaproteobacteria bacterium]|nr:hypothetical protein [Alphaproteobacteria bacterium]
MKKPMIGLYSSSMRSGKSTVAGLLTSHLFAKTMSFADPFRDAVIGIATPFIGSYQETLTWLGNERKDNAIIPELGVTLRWMLQRFGQFGRTALHEDVWVMLAEKRAQAAPELVVFDDMRFPNEYDMIKRNGGMCIRIVREGEPASEANGSEGLLDYAPFDITLWNRGSLNDLRKNVEYVARDILEKGL